MKKNSKLDNRQIRILEDYFGRSVAGESMEEIAKSYGISRKTLWHWKETDHGKRLHADYQKKMSTNDLPKFYAVLSEKMQTGSHKHMELYAKIHGILAPQKQEVVNIEETRDVVKDGYTKEDIAELEALMRGESLVRRVK